MIVTLQSRHQGTHDRLMTASCKRHVHCSAWITWGEKVLWLPFLLPFCCQQVPDALVHQFFTARSPGDVIQLHNVLQRNQQQQSKPKLWACRAVKQSNQASLLCCKQQLHRLVFCACALCLHVQRDQIADCTVACLHCRVQRCQAVCWSATCDIILVGYVSYSQGVGCGKLLTAAALYESSITHWSCPLLHCHC